MEDIEIWKDIPEYEGLHKVSNLGRIKSLERMVKAKIGIRINKERILVPIVDAHGYCVASLHNGTPKRVKFHQIVAITFLNHKPCGHKIVVNHIDSNKQNNNLANLELISQRENANQKRFKSSSKYVGVNWYKPYQKWVAKIWVNGKRRHLGYFLDEHDAHLAYEKELLSIKIALSTA